MLPGSKLRFGRINIARKTPFALSYDCDIFGRRPRVLLHCQAGNRGMRKSRKYSVISICRGLRGFWKKSIQIEDLPDEVLLRIFDYFSLQSILCQLSLVNRRWNKLTFSPCLWSKLQININVDSGLVETSINPILAKFESGLRTLSLWLRYPSQSGAVISALPQLPKLIKLDFNDTEQLTPANVTLLTQKFPSVRAANFSHCFDVSKTR